MTRTTGDHRTSREASRRRTAVGLQGPALAVAVLLGTGEPATAFCVYNDTPDPVMFTVTVAAESSTGAKAPPFVRLLSARQKTCCEVSVPHCNPTGDGKAPTVFAVSRTARGQSWSCSIELEADDHVFLLEQKGDDDCVWAKGQPGNIVTEGAIKNLMKWFE